MEQRRRRRKKKTLNGFACLVNHSSRGVTVCDDKQTHALFLPLHVHSQATAQPKTSTGHVASRCVSILYLAVHYQHSYFKSLGA